MPCMPYIPAPIDCLAPRTVHLIVIHCSATPSGRRLPASVIDSWHAQRGFIRQPKPARAYSPELPHIGYHFLIGLDGTVTPGRHVDEVGAHVRGLNVQSIGICLVGGAEPQARYSQAQWQSLASLVTELSKHYGIAQAAPTRAKGPRGELLISGGVCGHRDTSPDADGDGLVSPQEWHKTCPGFDVRAWLKNGLWPLPAHLLSKD
jgi:N-acetylmuramoyl-L-alanine amidase